MDMDIVRHVWVTTQACDCETYESLPDGTTSITVSDKETLERVRFTVNKGLCSTLAITIGDDIDLQTIPQTLIDADGNLIANPEGLDQWCPIGTDEHPFRGTFNGNGHTITGMYINTEYSQPELCLCGHEQHSVGQRQWCQHLRLHVHVRRHDGHHQSAGSHSRRCMVHARRSPPDRPSRLQWHLYPQR